MEAFQAGCDDYIDRTRPPAVIATHIKNIIVSKAEGFQPTQMLAQSDTSLSGSLTHHDLPGVMQMLGHAHQTGALHINSGNTDALLFFDAGTITHAECGSLFGDEAVIHILKNCFQNNSGVYKFVYGSSSSQRTVLRSATDLMLDAMREVDESTREPEVELSASAPATDADAITSSLDATVDAISSEPAAVSPEVDHSLFASSDETAEAEHADDAPAVASLVESSIGERLAEDSEPTSQDNCPEAMHPDDSDVIASLIDRYAAAPSSEKNQSTSLDDQSEVRPLDDHSALESLLDASPATCCFHDSEADFLDDRAELSQPEHLSETKSLVERPAIRHSNDFSAAVHPNQHFAVPPSLDHNVETSSLEETAAISTEDLSANAASHDDFQFATINQDHPQTEPQAGDFVDPTDADHVAETPDKESL
jgi:hypothetical protein